MVPEAVALGAAVTSLGFGAGLLFGWWREGSGRSEGVPASNRVEPLPTPPDGWTMEAVEGQLLAEARPTVGLRRDFPPHHRPTLSFFGGAPIGPPHLPWARSPAADGLDRACPLALQLDCRELPAFAHHAGLPRDGVLYFFLPHRPETASATHVLWAAGPTDTFRELPCPSDLASPFAADAARVLPWCAVHDPDSDALPSTFPRYPFHPGSLSTFPTLPFPAEAEETARRVTLALEHAAAASFHGPAVAPPPRGVLEPVDKRSLWRPHPAFPWSWEGVEIVAGCLLDAQRERLRRAAVDFRIPTVDAEILAWIESDCRAWIDRARAAGRLAPLTVTEHDEFWTWLTDLDIPRTIPPVGGRIDWDPFHAAHHALSTALTHSAESCLRDRLAAARVPAEIVDALRSRHAVLRQGSMRCMLHQLLGVPRDVQGAASARAGTHVLLLQLSWDPALGFHFGDAGAWQYWIRPADLARGRFDRIDVTRG